MDTIIKGRLGYNLLERYKNNFTLLEPQIRNILSGCDDIGEALTGNTEGMENQPVESR